MAFSVLITGCNGGIGSKLMEAFGADGWNTIGVDCNEGSGSVSSRDFPKADIASFVTSDTALPAFVDKIRDRTKKAPLRTLVNNAAVQNLGRLEEISSEAITSTININVIAPMLLVKEFLPELEANQGSVINIGSVHAQATKPGFSAYATSKSALHGLTRALAVDLGPKVLVNTLAPAATATPMLKAGFENDEKAFAALKDVHPLKRIAEPEEIARLALFLASDAASIMTGATIFADGGVLSRLHDPA